MSSSRAESLLNSTNSANKYFKVPAGPRYVFARSLTCASKPQDATPTYFLVSLLANVTTPKSKFLEAPLFKATIPSIGFLMPKNLAKSFPVPRGMTAIGISMFGNEFTARCTVPSPPQATTTRKGLEVCKFSTSVRNCVLLVPANSIAPSDLSSAIIRRPRRDFLTAGFIRSAYITKPRAFGPWLVLCACH